MVGSSEVERCVSLCVFDRLGMAIDSARRAARSARDRACLRGPRDGLAGLGTTLRGVRLPDASRCPHTEIGIGRRRGRASRPMVDNIRWEKAAPKVPTGEVERPPM